jgi:predicted RNA binding protein YcfA (HicA-like mRNA interferase family)
MPPKIRELIAELERAGFINRGGKGSHRTYFHPKGTKTVTISGQTGDDAQKYQIKQVKEAMNEVKNK